MNGNINESIRDRCYVTVDNHLREKTIQVFVQVVGFLRGGVKEVRALTLVQVES